MFDNELVMYRQEKKVLVIVKCRLGFHNLCLAADVIFSALAVFVLHEHSSCPTIVVCTDLFATSTLLSR